MNGEKAGMFGMSILLSQSTILYIGRGRKRKERKMADCVKIFSTFPPRTFNAMCSIPKKRKRRRRRRKQAENETQRTSHKQPRFFFWRSKQPQRQP